MASTNKAVKPGTGAELEDDVTVYDEESRVSLRDKGGSFIIEALYSKI